MARQQSKAANPQLIQDVQVPPPVNRLKPAARFPRRLLKAFRVSRRKVLIALPTVMVLLGGLFVIAIRPKQVPPIPARFSHILNVGLYHPTQLPEDMVFSPDDTFTEKDGVITKFTDTTGKGSLFLTQQKRPQQIDLKQIDAQETYLADVGTVYILKGERGRLQAIVETDESWILVDGPTSIGIARVKEVLSKLKAAGS